MACAAVVALAVSGFACGGSGQPRVPIPVTSPTPTKLLALDFRFEPATVPARSGRQVTLGITNTGTVDHNFSIPGLSVDTDVKPGETINVIFVAPGSGPLSFFCKFHQDRNMTGSLEVA